MRKSGCKWCGAPSVKAVAVSRTVKLPTPFQGKTEHQRVEVVRACARHVDKLVARS